MKNIWTCSNFLKIFLYKRVLNNLKKKTSIRQTIFRVLCEKIFIIWSGDSNSSAIQKVKKVIQFLHFNYLYHKSDVCIYSTFDQISTTKIVEKQKLTIKQLVLNNWLCGSFVRCSSHNNRSSNRAGNNTWNSVTGWSRL